MSDVIVKMLFGSHLYGLNNERSDTDYKGVVMPTAKQIILQKADFHISKSSGNDSSKNEANDVDEEYFSLARFLKLAEKGETVAIDMLHAPQSAILESNSLWSTIVANRNIFYTKNMKAYVGYVRKQAAKYGVKGSRLAVLEDAIKTIRENRELIIIEQLFKKLPIGEHSGIIKIENDHVGEQIFYEICGRKFQDSNRCDYVLECLEKIYNGYGERARLAKENDGIDWKAISHALRAGYQAKYIYQNGGFSYPLPETKFLKDVKEGRLDYLTEVQPVLEGLVDEVMISAGKSTYPEKANSKQIEKLLFDIHSGILK